MRRSTELFQKSVAIIVAASLLVAGLDAVAQADTANNPSLVISQLKITSSSGQFLTLYNPTGGALNMSNYQLEYFNSYDLTKATSSKLIALSGSLPPHSYFMVNDGALLLCYQLTVDSVSLGLSSTAGLVEVLAFNQATPGSSVTPTLEDYVGWSKTAATGAQTLPTSTNGFLQRQPVDSQSNPLINSAGTGTWQAVQPSASNACSLVSGTSMATPVATGLNQLLPGVEPAATIISLASDMSSTPTTPNLPTGDIGLMAPEITEILPNPSGTGNDATDEFIELYNPNAGSFDLTGFSLQSGTTALHNYVFPSGTSLPASSFTGFYSSTTGLSLSNSGGQVKLLDPFSNSISATSVYGTAKDGQAWALANDAWYWTTALTPGSANVIKQPVTTSKSSTSSTKSKTTKSSSVKSASTAKTSASGTSGQSSNTAAVTPIHAWALAVVAGLALLYGAYEYRADLRNRLYQFRKHFRTRSADRT